ncbi:MAG TPA: AAA family ATPase [Solirubrobacteraceae bacterium]|nr:AAA family ATPase [Solirubrobacteraceae bacterium]
MSYAEETGAFRAPQQTTALAREWRAMTRAATLVALLTAPAFYLVLHDSNHVSVPAAALLTLVAIVLFRGLVEVIVRRLIPSPSLLGGDSELKAEDIISRRRYWFWRTWWRRIPTLAVVGFVFYLLYLVICNVMGSVGGVSDFWHPGRELHAVLPAQDLPQILLQFIQLAIEIPLFLLINVLIFIGPFALMSARSIKSYEPGDASWGVKLSDVRGQADAKQEISRVITLWQSGEEFEKAGGKRERGLLFLGAPGTGKTMISKAIATSFNCPFVTIPGSGFAGMFIGMDTLTVWLLARRARRLARKWGGQCIVFIDEIDAVGMRRQALGTSMTGPGATLTSAMGPTSLSDLNFHGPHGALTASGDVIIETRQWREQLFARRAVAPGARTGLGTRVAARVNAAMPFMGYQGNALNALLVVMDGMNEPPALRKWWTNRVNTLLDATFLIPQRVGGAALRLPPAKPRTEEIYFIGACNVPIEALDPALTRPGRMGRHIWFRTPTKEDRKDIFDLYISRVDHEPDLDTDHGRDELARITSGYSPAMIEQSCSMALTIAQAEGRPVFSRRDILEAMTTVEAGTATNIEYIPEETRAVAIHEAGHAAAGHVYLGDEILSTRLSIRMRGGSLGHYQGMDKDERFSHFRSRVMGSLVMTLGAMAAEHVFYGENSQGVSGDLQSATRTAAAMVGIWGMGPDPVAFALQPRREPSDDLPVERQEATGGPLGRLGAGLLPGGSASGGARNGPASDAVRDRQALASRRLEQIGNQLMSRASVDSMLTPDPLAAVLNSPEKRRGAAILLGQAYVTAYSLMATNRAQVERIADQLSERKEIHGDDVIALLNSVGLTRPEIDLGDDATWPTI